jgi:phosphomannomutase/phosphoglucomutase
LGARKLKVVVDAGNGMGGVTAIPLYERLGVEVIELFCEPDSSFPVHEPDPSQEENLQDLIEKVLETHADLGIAFDGDADRITIIDDKGRIIWGDELMILLAREVLKQNPNSTVIAEVKCTQVLFDEIEKLGGKSIMSKAGHSIIKAKMRETNAVLAGEMSGHIFFADKFYGFDDAAYAGARVLEILSKTDKKLSEIFAEFPQTVSTPEIRFECAEEKKAVVLEKIIEEFSKTNEVITIDGARINFENGWGLVRSSNTQALLILRFEADTPENLQNIREMVENKVRAFL